MADPYRQQYQSPPAWPPQPAPPRRPKRSSGRLLFGVLGLLVGSLLGGVCVGAFASSGKPDSSAAPGVTTVYVTAPGAPAASTAAPAPAGPRTSFGDGTYEVNADIVPGTYKTTVPTSGRSCYWKRLKDFNGAAGSILDNGTAKAGSPVTVKILQSDAGFEATACGTWTKTG